MRLKQKKEKTCIQRVFTILLLPILRLQFLLRLRLLPILLPSFSPPIWVWAPNNTHAWFFKDFHTAVDEDNALRNLPRRVPIFGYKFRLNICGLSCLLLA